MSKEKASHSTPKSFQKWAGKSRGRKDKSRGKTPEEDAALFDEEGLEKRLQGDEAKTVTKPVLAPRQESVEELFIPPPPTPEPPSQRRRSEVAYTKGDNLEEARSVAIEGYEIPEAEHTEEPARQAKRLSRSQKVLIGSAAFILLAAIGVFFYFYFKPSPPLQMNLSDQLLTVQGAPIPVGIVLPDGQAFDLAAGVLVDGNWVPERPEWLSGSQVPRWLAIPWTKKLEQAAKAFKTNDLVHLQMSNGDTLDYRFQWMQDVPVQKIAAYHKNSAELLILLSKPRGSSRLILVAIP